MRSSCRISASTGRFAIIFPGWNCTPARSWPCTTRRGRRSCKKLGFARVILARELTFEEVGDITATSGIETEVFVHGALCYSYSGLCLFSSQTLGRSGNRGKCAYSCRDSFNVTGAPDSLRDGTAVHRDPSQGFPFSMKDLALPDHMPDAARRRRVVLQDRRPQEEPALRGHDHRILPQDSWMARLEPTQRQAMEARSANGLQPAMDPAVRAVAQGQGSRRPRHRRPSRNADRQRRGDCRRPSRPFAFSHQPGPGTARRPADRSAVAGQAVRVRHRKAVDGQRKGDADTFRRPCWKRSASPFCRTRRIAGRGAAAGRLSNVTDRGPGLLFLVASGEAALSLHAAQTGPVQGSYPARSAHRTERRAFIR